MADLREIPFQRRYVVVPIAAFAVLAAAWGRDLPSPVLLALGLVLVAAVLTAVHHAEVVALKVGEPFGSLVLAVAVTAIEVGLIVVLMLSSPETTQTLARDAVFSTLIIACNGIVGLSLLVASLRHYTANFNSEGVTGALAALATLATLTMVLPAFTTSSAGGTFTTPQLVFVSISAVVIYLVFVFVQTIRHRDFFLPVDLGPKPQTADGGDADEAHVEPPSRRRALLSLGLLLVSLVAVVGLAKTTSPLIESAVADLGLPTFVIAVSIALLVLLPESIAAVRAAARGRTQTSLNLAYGSVLAAIGLTIPTIAIVSLAFDFDIVLGLSSTGIALVALTFLVGTLTVSLGRATLLQGAVHLSIFAGFILLALNP
jgi:Ca2+:H+ antiporter